MEALPSLSQLKKQLIHSAVLDVNVAIFTDQAEGLFLDGEVAEFHQVVRWHVPRDHDGKEPPVFHSPDAMSSLLDSIINLLNQKGKVRGIEPYLSGWDTMPLQLWRNVFVMWMRGSFLSTLRGCNSGSIRGLRPM